MEKNARAIRAITASAAPIPIPASAPAERLVLCMELVVLDDGDEEIVEDGGKEDDLDETFAEEFEGVLVDEAEEVVEEVGEVAGVAEELAVVAGACSIDAIVARASGAGAAHVSLVATEQ